MLMQPGAWALLIKAITILSLGALLLVAAWRYPYVMRAFKIALFEGSPTFDTPVDVLDRDRCPVLAYFVQFNGSEKQRKNSVERGGHSEMTAMLALWMRNWFYRGKDPAILTLSDAQKHPKFKALDTIFRSFPTVNNPLYELACYHRWLAFAAAGAGTLMDFDILATGAFDFGKSEELSCGRRAPLTSYFDYEPMVTHGSPEEVQRFIDLLATYELRPEDMVDGKPHISDMLITQKYRKELFGNNYITESKPAIHFSSEQIKQFKDAVKVLTGGMHPWGKQVGRTWLMNRVAQLQYSNRHSILILAPPGSNYREITSLMGPLIDPWESDDKLIIDIFAEQSWTKEPRTGQHVAENALLKRGTFTQSVTWLNELPRDGLAFMDDIPGAVLFIWLTEPVYRVLDTYSEERHFEQRRQRPQNSMSTALKTLDQKSGMLDVGYAERVFGDKRVFTGFVDDIGTSRLVLEYFTGCLLSSNDEGWFGTKRRENNQPSKEQRRVFETYEHNDVLLYQLARKKFEKRKAAVDRVEARLAPFIH